MFLTLDITSTVHLASIPFSALTVIVTLPSFLAVTFPFASTVTILLSLLFHVNSPLDKLSGSVVAF